MIKYDENHILNPNYFLLLLKINDLKGVNINALIKFLNYLLIVL